MSRWFWKENQATISVIREGWSFQMRTLSYTKNRSLKVIHELVKKSCFASTSAPAALSYCGTAKAQHAVCSQNHRNVNKLQDGLNSSLRDFPYTLTLASDLQ